MASALIVIRRTPSKLPDGMGDLLLVASLVSIGPAWVGGVELLSAFGIESTVAAFLSGAYVSGRGVLSAGLLVRHARHGSLDLGASWLTSDLESVTLDSPLTKTYPRPTAGELSLARTPPVA